jgi:SPP1 family predicted phage head-tail adaptor
MNAGKLNRRITLVPPPTKADDGYGGTTETPGTTSSTWCAAKPLSQSEVLRRGIEAGTRAYEFTFRYEAGMDLTQAWGLTYESRSFRIVSVLEIDERKRMIKVQANERTN